MPLKKLKVERRELKQMSKRQVFDWYREHINDEVGPFMYRAMTKQELIDCIVGVDNDMTEIDDLASWDITYPGASFKENDNA